MGNVDVVISGRFIRDVVGLKAKFLEAGYLVTGCSSNQNPPMVIVSRDQSEHRDVSSIVASFQDAGQLHATSDKPVGFDGVAECPGDGVAKHTLSIALKDFSGNPLALNCDLQAITSQIAPVSNSKPAMTSGVASVAVGPVTGSGEIEVVIVDQAKKHFRASVKVRFL
jgi:hypothetical protein